MEEENLEFDVIEDESGLKIHFYNLGSFRIIQMKNVVMKPHCSKLSSRSKPTKKTGTNQ